MKEANRRKLLQEYEKCGREPVVLLLNHQKVIIPAEYVLSGGGNEEIRRRFLRDYLDGQKQETVRYAEAGVVPEKVVMNGVAYVVPFRLRQKNYKDTEVVDFVLRRAAAKYERAVTLTRKLDKIYPERAYTVEVAGEHVRNMERVYHAYLLRQCRDYAKAAAVRAFELVHSGARLMKGKQSPFKSVKTDMPWRKLAIGSMIVGGGLGISSQFSEGEKSDDKNIRVEEAVETQMPAEEENTISFEEAVVLSEPTKKTVEKRLSASKAKAAVDMKGQKFQRSDAQKDKLFRKFTREIFASEGGYADKTIDQPTNMGIIQPTLNAFVKRYSKEARAHKFPSIVKKLTRAQAELVYRKLYFDQYQIGNYRNESIGMLIYDIYVNHQPETAKLFIEQALKAARKTGVKLKLPLTTSERVAVVNSLASYPKAEAVFYEQMMKERRFHMYKNTTLRVKKGEVSSSRFAAGLRNRANKYNDRYVSTAEQEGKTQLALNLMQKHR